MKTILTKYLLLLALTLPASHVWGADAPPSNVVVFDHVKVDDAFAKGLPLLVNANYKVLAGRRVQPGIVEIHERDTDIFYVTEGTATLTTGGVPTAPKVAEPGEIRGDKISGGVARKLTKGDMVIIPAGVPHWFSEVSGTFLYLVIKVTK